MVDTVSRSMRSAASARPSRSWHCSSSRSRSAASPRGACRSASAFNRLGTLARRVAGPAERGPLAAVDVEPLFGERRGTVLARPRSVRPCAASALSVASLPAFFLVTPAILGSLLSLRRSVSQKDCTWDSQVVPRVKSCQRGSARALFLSSVSRLARLEDLRELVCAGQDSQAGREGDWRRVRSFFPAATTRPARRRRRATGGGESRARACPADTAS